MEVVECFPSGSWHVFHLPLEVRCQIYDCCSPLDLCFLRLTCEQLSNEIEQHAKRNNLCWGDIGRTALAVGVREHCGENCLEFLLSFDLTIGDPSTLIPASNLYSDRIILRLVERIDDGSSLRNDFFEELSKGGRWQIIRDIYLRGIPVPCGEILTHAARHNQHEAVSLLLKLHPEWERSANDRFIGKNFKTSVCLSGNVRLLRTICRWNKCFDIEHLLGTMEILESRQNIDETVFVDMIVLAARWSLTADSARKQLLKLSHSNLNLERVRESSLDRIECVLAEIAGCTVHKTSGAEENVGDFLQWIEGH